MSRRARVMLWALAWAVLAAGPGQAKPPPEISFRDLPPITLAVDRVEYVNAYKAPLKAPNVDHEFPIRPESVARRWAEDRLRAAGGTGVARLTVTDGAVTEVALKTKSGLFGLFKAEQAFRYDAVLAVRISVTVDGTERAFATAKVEHSRTVPEDATLEERDAVWLEMAQSLGESLNRKLEAGIREFLASYVR